MRPFNLPRCWRLLTWMQARNPRSAAGFIAVSSAAAAAFNDDTAMIVEPESPLPAPLPSAAAKDGLLRPSAASRWDRVAQPQTTSLAAHSPPYSADTRVPAAESDKRHFSRSRSRSRSHDRSPRRRRRSVSSRSSSSSSSFDSRSRSRRHRCSRRRSVSRRSRSSSSSSSSSSSGGSRYTSSSGGSTSSCSRSRSGSQGRSPRFSSQNDVLLHLA